MRTREDVLENVSYVLVVGGSLRDEMPSIRSASGIFNGVPLCLAQRSSRLMQR